MGIFDTKTMKSAYFVAVQQLESTAGRVFKPVDYP